jgi:hypothetical protein
MKKSLIIGMATIAVASTALIGSSIYAATNSGTTGGERTHKMQKMQKRGNETLTLSGVSTEAKTAFTDLQKKHKQEMDALRTQSGVTEDQLQAKHEAFKTEMDALITKYPELKNALAQTGGKM